jgi:hypothetical protein
LLPARALNSLIPSANPYKLRTQTHYTQNPNMHRSWCRLYQQAASNQASRNQATKQPSLPPMSSSFDERKKLVGKTTRPIWPWKKKNSQFKKKKKKKNPKKEK